MSAAAPDFSSGPINIQPPSFGGYAGQEGGLPGVGFWPRAVARIIDLVVHYFIGICSGLLFGTLLYAAARAAGQSTPAVPRHAGAAVFVFALVGSVAYETICEAGHGSTLGKLMLGMSVVQEDGTPCRTGPALIRSLAYFIDGLVFGLVGYLAMNKTPQEQRHGDVWAHTVVCKRSNIPPQSLRGTGRFLAVFLLAVMADTAMMIVGLFIHTAR